PAFRHPYLQSVARQECGPIRSVFVGTGTVLALIPPGDPKQRADWFGQIADEHRKNQGEKPQRIIPLEYRIDVDQMGGEPFATLTRQPSIEAGDLFDEAAGYFERTIVGLSDLDEFL